MRRVGARTARLAVAVLVAPLLVAVPTGAQAQEVPAGSRTVQYGVGGLQPLQPARLLDTRETGETVDGQQQREGAIAAAGTRLLTVAGRGGVPVAGAGAAWLNVTVTRPSGPGFVTVFPAGAATPNASNVNFTAGQTVPNLVLAKLGVDGRVAVLASTSTHVIVDVVGWVPEGPDVQPLQPARVLDTRGTGQTVDGQQRAGGAVGPGQTRRLPVTGRAGVPSTGVAAAVLNLTATGTTAGGFLTAFPAGTTRPNASTLNFAARQTVPNLVVAKVGSNGAVDLYNSHGSTHLIADVVGWIPDTSSYGSLQPSRVMDTRGNGVTVDGQAKAGGAVRGGEARRLPVTGRAGVPATGVGAVVLNVTATAATRTTHLTVFPTGSPQPNASNLNVGAGTTRANLVTAKVGGDGSVSIANAAGDVHVIADVVGWFPSGTSGAQTGAVTMVLPETTELAGAGDVLALTGTAAAPTSLLLAPSADVPPVGGHLVVMPNAVVPDGTLVRVTATTPQSDGSVLLTVQRAAVPDAFLDLTVDYAGPLVLDERPATGPSLRRQGSLLEAGRDFGFGPVAGGGFACTGTGSADVSFDAGFQSSKAEIAYDLSDRYLRFVVRTTPTVTAGATATSTATCTRHLELPGKLPLGPTGLSLSAELDLTAVVSGSITVTAGVATPLALGFEYRAGTVTNLSSASYSGSAEFGSQGSGATLTVTPAVEFDLEFLGAVEMGLALGLPITGSLTPGPPCAASVSVAGTLGASAELELPWLPDIQQDLGSYDLGSRQVWSGGCGEPEPPVTGTRTASLSMTYDQPRRTATSSDGLREETREQALAVTFPTVTMTAGRTSNTAAPTSLSTGLPAAIPTAGFEYIDTQRTGGGAECVFRHTGFREAGQVRQPTFPDATGSTWEWYTSVVTADLRPLDQARAGETVWVNIGGYLQGVATVTVSGNCDPFTQEYLEPAYLEPSHSSITDTNCADGASLVTFEGLYRDCGFPVVVQADGGIRLQRTISTHEEHGWTLDGTPVTYTVDLQISRPQT